MTIKTLLLATHNQGKVEEFEKILSPMGIELKSNKDFNLPEPEETETTFTGNALIKAKAAMNATGLPSLADDSGLSIDALKGAPGVYSADWAEAESGRDFGMAMQRVHDELGSVDGTQAARFYSVLALVFPDGSQEVFEGTIDGAICWPPRGEGGHGYDPIFIPENDNRAFAEMSADEKNAISHRARSTQKFMQYLKNND